MTLRLLLLSSLVLVACPERTVPEHGLQLVYKKPDPGSIRSVVDRRLAQLKLRANLSEDDSRLTVRVAEGADVARLKALLAQPGKLEFCKEDGTVALRWCEEKWPAGLLVEHGGTTCSLQADSRRALEAALPDAGDELAWGLEGARTTAWPIAGCLSIRVAAAEVRDTPPSINLEFDRAGGKEFAALTTATVGRHLLIRLDGVVTSAPVVQEPITGGRAMITAGQRSRADLELLAASLVGGALPVLVLEKEGTWGPPSFRP